MDIAGIPNSDNGLYDVDSEPAESGPPSDAPPPPIIRIQVSDVSDASKIEETLDSQLNNWSVWSQSMYLLFDIINAAPYVEGTIERPDPRVDPEAAATWSFNDSYIRMLIGKNIASDEKIHICGCKTAYHMWKNLSNIHHTTGVQVQTSVAAAP